MAALLLSGCAVGPDFQKPAAPQVSDYTPMPLVTTDATPDATGGEAQRFARGGDIGSDWWTLYHSPALDSLIASALKNNSDLKAAEAALKSAHETALAGRGGFYPQVGLSASAYHYQQPATLAPVPSNNAIQYSLFTPQLNVSYMPDVFGLQSRTVESLDAQAEAVRYQMMATYNTLVNNVVSVAIQEASVRRQIEATNDMIAAMNKSLDILKYQLDRGYASGVDYNAQKATTAAAEAMLPPLVKQDAQLKDQLAVLVGRYPSEQPEERLDLSTLMLPQDIPVSFPSKLVGTAAGCPAGRGQSPQRQRPDRRRRGKPAAQSHACRPGGQFGAGLRPVVQRRHRLLERRLYAGCDAGLMATRSIIPSRRHARITSSRRPSIAPPC